MAEMWCKESRAVQSSAETERECWAEDERKTGKPDGDIIDRD
jgi:hypothetical protein